MNTADRTLVASYSQAIFGAAKKMKVLDAVAAQAVELRGLLTSNPKLVTFMMAPNIAREEKERLFAASFGGRFEDLLVNFLRLLSRRGRLLLLVPCLKALHELYLKDMGVAPGIVTTATELSEEQRKEMEAALSAFTGKTLKMEYRVDAALIGGVNFRSGDLMVDNTLRESLKRLERNLRATRVY